MSDLNGQRSLTKIMLHSLFSAGGGKVCWGIRLKGKEMGRRTWETGFNYQEVLAWNASKITFSIKPEKKWKWRQ